MRRFLTEKLEQWRKKPNRKPLLLYGARQVGKTWLMKDFGSRAFEETVYINFDKDHRLHELLEQTLEPARILSAIALLYGVTVRPEKTLLIFDEVQEEPRALASLKYFCEEAPEIVIMAAGSFMGIALRKGTSFPVGKVDVLTLYPLSYPEFLYATEGEARFKHFQSGSMEEICALKSIYIEALRNYYVIGGMPEVVQLYIVNRDISACRVLQEELVDLYRQDFVKHAPVSLVPRLNQVWNALPMQLAKENRKFIYGQVQKGARADDFEMAIQWLSDCGLIHVVHRVSKPGIPLAAYSEISAFKLFLHDVGILGAMAGLPVDAVISGERLFSEFKGALTEQYVLQQLISVAGIMPYYYSSENSRGEIDFLLQKDGIIPVEVKAEENLKAKSLRAFVDKFGPMKAIRISMSDYREQEWLTNLPLYSFTRRFT